jgi:hypothetical protein
MHPNSTNDLVLEQPTALRQLTARMGWSPNSHTMVDIYTRGVEMDFSRDRIPLMSSRVRPSAPRLPAALPPPRVQPAEDLTAELAAAVRNNPELVRALLQALRGVA